MIKNVLAAEKFRIPNQNRDGSIFIYEEYKCRIKIIRKMSKNQLRFKQKKMTSKSKESR